MADIELAIKIPEGLKKDFELEQWTALSCMEMKNALMKSIPFPKGHGDLKDMGNLKYVFDLTKDEPIYSGKDIERAIKSMKSIIEADKAENEDKE